MRDLFKDEFRFVAPPGSPLLRERTINVRKIDTREVLLLEVGHCLGERHQSVRSAPRDTEDKSGSNEPLYAHADGRRGLGVMLLPALAVECWRTAGHAARRAAIHGACASPDTCVGGAA